MILVTGATGKLGGLVIQQLLQKVPGNQIVAAVRDPGKAADLAKLGVRVRLADYDRPATLESALAGVDKVLLISASEPAGRLARHRAVVDAAKKAGVRLLVYTSILHAASSTLALAAGHRATEEAIRASGLPFVLLRNGWYIENYTENLGPMLAHGAVLGSSGDGRVAGAARADFAAAAVAVLTGGGQENRIYELGGDVPFSMADLAAEVSRRAGKPVVYRDLRPADYRAELVGAGVPAPFADLLVDSSIGIAGGELDDESGDLRRLIGRPTTRLADAVAAVLPV